MNDDTIKLIKNAEHNAKVDAIKEAEKELAKQLGPKYEVRSSFTNYTFYIRDCSKYVDNDFVTLGEFIKKQSEALSNSMKQMAKLQTEIVKLKFPIESNKKPVVKNFDSSKAKEFIPKPVEPFVTPIKNDNNEITW